MIKGRSFLGKFKTSITWSAAKAVWDKTLFAPETEQLHPPFTINKPRATLQQSPPRNARLLWFFHSQFPVNMHEDSSSSNPLLYVGRWRARQSSRHSLTGPRCWRGTRSAAPVGGSRHRREPCAAPGAPRPCPGAGRDPGSPERRYLLHSPST